MNDRPVSRQARHQRRRVERGLCAHCGQPREPERMGVRK